MTKEDAQRTIDLWNAMVDNAKGLLKERLGDKPFPEDEVEIVVATFCLMKQEMGFVPPGSDREDVQRNLEFINELRKGNLDAYFEGPT